MVAQSFIFGRGTANPTPEDLKKRREFNQAIRAAGSSTAPVRGGAVEAVARALQGALGGYFEGQDDRLAADQREKAGADFKAGLADMLAGGSALSYSPSAPTASAVTTPGAAPDAAVSKPVDLSGDRKTFVDTLMPAAMEASQRTGVDPRLIVAQAAQETGWGKSAPGNNYFGIKSHGQGGGQNLATEEVIDGKRVKVRDSFRSFDSPAASVAGYADFLLENPRYGKMRAAQGLDAQLEALGASGYATDPNYARSVGAIARGIQMPAGPQASTVPPVDPTASAAPLPEARISVAQAYDQAMAKSQPVQVASLDPAIGMDSALGYDPRRGMDVPAQPQQTASLAPLPPPREVAPNPVPPPQPDVAAQAYAGLSDPVKQMATADAGFDGFAQTGGNVRGAPAAPSAPSQDGVAGRLTAMLARPVGEPVAPPAPSSDRSARLLNLLANPWLDEGQRSVASFLLKDDIERRGAADKRAYDARKSETDRANAIADYQTKAEIDAANQKPTYGVVGKDEFGNEQYGWIDPAKRTATPISGAPAAPATASDIPPAPPGVDPKAWRKEFSERAAAGAMPAKGDDVTSLRKEVQQLPSYKNLAQAAPIYRSMVEAAGRDTKASDLNMVYGLGKIMDPTSVVREGEIVMANDTQGLADKLNGFTAGIQGEGRLRPEAREQIMQEAFGRLSSYRQAFGQDTDFYKGIAGRNRMRVEDVIPNFGEFPEWKAPATAPAAATPAPASPAPTPPQPSGPAIGEIVEGYRFKGGNPADMGSWEKVR